MWKGEIRIKKVILILLSLILLSIIVLGCSSPVDSKSIAKEIVVNYKTLLYNVSDYTEVNDALLNNNELIRYIEGFKGFMTEEGYKRFWANRIPTMPIKASYNGKFTLKMASIDFKIITEESNKIIMEYEVNLQASYPDTNKVEPLIETGEIALIKENNTWRINHDRFRVADLIRQELRMGQGATMSF